MSKQAWAGAVVASLMIFNGCGGGFFIDTKTTTSTGSTTGDYVYAVNPASNTINEFSLTGATLALISGSPVALPQGLSGASVAVSRADTYVYVGGSQVISSYTIGTSGALTLSAATAATGSANTNFISLDTSPDGQWLLALDSLTQTIYVYQINTSSGALTLKTQAAYVANGNGSGNVSPHMIRISPTGAYVAIALGTNGTELYSFNTSNAALTLVAGVPLTTGASDNAVTFDGTSLSAAANLFIARGGLVSGASQVLSYGINSSGALTGNGNPIVSGNVPYGLLVENTGAYLYAANRGDSTVSGYTFQSGTVSTTAAPAALSGSPYATGSGGVLALVEDKSAAYIVGAGGNGNAGKDLTLYTFGVVSPGVLSPVATATTGAAGITAIAATH